MRAEPGEERDPDTKPSTEERAAQAPDAVKATNAKVGAAKGQGAGPPLPPPDKVSFVDPVINRDHTTFYAQVFFDQKAGLWRQAPVMSLAEARPDIACNDGQGAKSVGSTVCKVVKESVDVKPWERRGAAPAHDPQYYSGNAGDQPATKEGFLLPKEEGLPTKKEKKAAAGSPAANAEDKKKVEKKEKAEEKKEATKVTPTPAKAEEAKFIYIARQLPNGEFIYQKPDIACRDGQGANSVGSTVCDIVKNAVDVKPWERNGPAPSHAPQYYHDNEGDIPANADGTLKGFLVRRVDQPYGSWGSYAQETPEKVPQARTTFYDITNGVWRQVLAQGDAPTAEEQKAPADDAKAEAPKTVAELHPEWENSQQQIGWAQQRAANAENFADQRKLYKSWQAGKAVSDQWSAYEYEGGLTPPPLPYKSAAEKKADAAAAEGAANKDTPPAGDANSDGKLAAEEKKAAAAKGESIKEEFEKAQAEKNTAEGEFTEKVHSLEPMAYERRQNYNKLKEYAPRPTPEPYIMRTTFY